MSGLAEQNRSLRRRVTNQREELARLNKAINHQFIVLQLAWAQKNETSLKYAAIRNAKYKTKWWKWYVWWRNQVLWRIGYPWRDCSKDYWYNRGKKDGEWG